MTENIRYWAIVQEMPAGLGRDVMTALQGHVGVDQRVGRDRLVGALLRLPEYRGKNAVRMDRLVRLAIADLQEAGYPILSSSGLGGYWLAGSREEIEGMCAEIESRAERLQDKARALRGAKKLVYEDEPVVIQMSFGSAV